MAIYRGTGGSVEGITEADILTIAISQGGTGAQTAAGARTNLGLGTAATTAASDYATAAQGTLADSALQDDDIGVSVQAYGAQLADVAGLTPTDNGVIIGNGTNFVVESGSTLRSSLGLAIGTDVLAPNGSAASLTSFPTLNQDTTGTAANVSGVVAIANGGTGQATAALARAALLPTFATNGGKVLAVKSDASDVEYITAGAGTVTSVAMSVPTGLSVSGSPVTTTGTLAVSLTSGYAIPTTAKQTEWDTAYTDRNKWDGGSTGLTAATGRTSLGLGTAATTDATAYATAAQGAKADTALQSETYTGTVTSVGGTGTVNGLSLSGTVTSSGNLTLGGTLDLSSPPAIGGTTPSTGSFSTLKVGSSSILGNANADVTLGVAVRNSGATLGYFQIYNSNAGTDLKTWRLGNNGSGSLVFETVNDAYSSSANKMTLDTSGNLTATTFNGTIDGGTY